MTGDSSGFEGGFVIEDGALIAGSDQAFGGRSISMVGRGPTLGILDGVTVGSDLLVQNGGHFSVIEGQGTFTGEISEQTPPFDQPGGIPFTVLVPDVEEEPTFPLLTKIGAGELVFTDEVNVVDVDLAVANGLLTFNGTTNRAIMIRDAGALGGNGTLMTLAVGNGGTLAPGNSIGTLVVTGDTSFAAGSRFEVELAANGTSDRLEVGGTAALDGSVAPSDVDPAADYAARQRYTILTAAGGIADAFDGVEEDAALVEYELSQDDNNVYLTRIVVTQEPPAEPEEEEPQAPEEPDEPEEEEPQTPQDPEDEEPQAPEEPEEPEEEEPQAEGADDPLPDFGLPAEGSNATQLAMVLSEFDFSGRDETILNSLLNLNEAELNLAYRMLGGQIHAEVGRASAELSQVFNGAMLDAAGSVVAASEGAAGLGSMPVALSWAEVYGNGLDVDGDGNASGLTRDSYGVAVGTETGLSVFGDQLTVGVALGYSDAHLALTEVSETADIQSLHLGIYTESGAAPTETGIAYTSALSYGRHDIATERNIAFGSVDRTATDEYMANSLNVSVKTSYNVALDNRFGLAMASPFVALHYSQVEVGDVDETGAGSLNLSGSDNGDDWAAMSVGVTTTGTFSVGGNTVSTSSTLAYEKVLGDSIGSATLMLDGSPASFEVQGVDQSRDRIRAGAQGTMAIGDSTSLSVALDGIFAEDREELNVSTSVSFTF
ncbi:hypothetical protein OG2516_18015 [Oceanicola granulosus HTCC2516]|uniref:Autotransporter domain-containing protein n=1 Tax=Oceanicola granulosus (strain ATCC BAA-861 / DSM 15982 / KCTC 12143 / HTCC2516) TaxID=314256 RepID=Q2CEP1_OCEGH|nr:hypothetical protein OG2516_18015 [Oceanicola granulosus HTCC2516]